MEFNKKAISPVVATALLLVVAVVAVVGFQTWFQTYQSGLNTQVEQQSQTGSAVSIERLDTDGSASSVYVANTAVNEVTADVSISEESGCENSSVALTAENVTEVNLNGCGLTEDDTYDVIVRTDDNVFTETEIAR